MSNHILVVSALYGLANRQKHLVPGNLFEKELNVSVVHWIRKTLGITLPNYFNKYEPDKNALIELRSSSINFNNTSKGDWLPPGIGQSLIGFEKQIRNYDLENWNKEAISLLKSEWENIRNIRNAAAHTSFIIMFPWN